MGVPLQTPSGPEGKPEDQSRKTKPEDQSRKTKPEDRSQKPKPEEKTLEEAGDRRPRVPSGGGGGGSTPPISSSEGDGEDSSVDTSAIRSMLKRRVHQQMERPKSSLGSVKVEEFAGERFKYTKWKKAVEAQQELYRLEEQELAMLVYLSTKRDARDCLDQAPISEFTRPGGLRLVWRLLDEAFGETEEELLERAEKELGQYRRLPGQPVSAYIGQMKRLRAQYQRVDPDTQLSDRAWAQRLLNRCSLSRRERLDVFFSAGGQYEPQAIERALRHRCANTHEDERRVPTPLKPTRTFKPRAYDDKKKTGYKKVYKRVYAAGREDEEEGEAEEEDLEEEGQNEVFLEEGDAQEAEDMGTIEEEGEWDPAEEDDENEEEMMMEAYAAGWKAKARMGDKKKARGWSQPSNGNLPPSISQKKAASHCASCGQRGHWKGDPQCPNVKSGKDKPHGQVNKKPTTSSGNAGGGNPVHFTYVVSTTQKRTKTKEEKTVHVPPTTSCPKCRWPSVASARFCANCGHAMNPDERMPEGKRGWTVVRDDEDEDQVPSSESSRPEDRPRMYYVSKDRLREAAGMDSLHQRTRVKASPEEVLAALPTMSRKEKKEIQKALVKEESQHAFERLERSRLLAHYDSSSSEDERDPGAAGSQMPVRPKAAASPIKGGYMEESRKKDLPKPVKDRMLAQFRKDLCDNQTFKGKIRPSACAPTPTVEQARCPHPQDRLRWSANGDGHYASCRDCGLKHVIYFSERHGAWVVNSNESHEVFLSTAPGMAIMDSGCRSAVAGEVWHQEFQAQLKRMGLSWHEEPEEESFQFGSGEPETSHRGYIYPVGIHGSGELIRMSCVGGGARNCPGLVGPSEMARWNVIMSFADKKIQIKGTWKPMSLTATRHPAVCLLDFGEDVAQFWSRPEIQDALKMLVRSPQSWAFKADKLPPDEGSSEEEDEESEGSDGPSDKDYESFDEEAIDRHRLETALERLEKDLTFIPVQEAQKQSDDEEWEIVQGSDDEEASVTSHEFGVQHQEEESTDEESETEAQDEKEVHGPVKHMSKAQRSEWRHNTRGIQDTYVQRKNEAKEKITRQMPRVRRSKSGPWKVLEVFTWTCMISLCAVQRGNWQMMEPVTLPNWDLHDMEHQNEALKYMEHVDPDLLVIAWPCCEWSPLQDFGKKSAQQLKNLGERRQKARVLLHFVKKAVKAQRARGGAVLGENPKPSKAWLEPDIQEAFEGMGDTTTDMCQYNLRKPNEEFPEEEPMYLKKRTRLRGTPEILKHCSRLCTGHQHLHTPVLGGVKINGHWKALSEFAGGYTKAFASQVLKGAEEYLKKGRVQESFVSKEEVPEERFETLEDVEQESEDEAEGKEEAPIIQRNRQLDLLHRRLGHPSNEVLARMLRLAGAEKWLQDAAHRLQCDTCGSGPIPRRPMNQRGDARPWVFNESIGIDLKFTNDCSGQRYVALSMVDLATNFHQGVLLKNRNPEHVAQKFLTKWVAMFGAPTWISLDQGGEWEAEFILFLEHYAIGTKFTGSHAAWQLGHTERHGALLGIAWGALIHEHQVKDRSGMKITLMCALQGKNQVITRRGFSANALVFGRQSCLPDLLEDEAITSTTLGQALSMETEVARQAEMRSIAKRALLHQDAQQKLKNALVRKPGGQIKEFLPGEKIFFWVPRARKGRYRHDHGEWRGPAVVIVKESHEKYFCSWRSRCLLLAAANMRGATLEENARAGVEELELNDGQEKTYEDLTEIRQPEKEVEQDKTWEAQEDSIKFGKRHGRSRRQAVEMMKGLRGVRRLVQSKFGKEVSKRRKKERPSRKDEEIKRQAAAEEKEYEQRFEDLERQRKEMEEAGYEPSIPEGKEEENEEEESRRFWEEISAQEEAYAKEDEKRIQEQKERRKKLLDDVPMSLKRKKAEEGEEEPSMKLPRTMFQQLQVMVSDQDLTGRLKQRIMKKGDEKQLKNQWLPRNELKQIRRLLDLPVSAARLHRAPRKKLQAHPQKKNKRRVTLMLLEEPGQALLLDEKKNEAKRKKCSASWRGMTLFVNEVEKTPEPPQCAYIQVGKDVFQKELKDADEANAWQELLEREHQWQKYREVLLLKMKASGKELDPKWFNEEEAEAFKDSDLREWEAWIDNGVIKRLTPTEASRIPSSQIFRTPLRMVRVNKAKDSSHLQPKSRLVVPGHTDPAIGEYRTDSPTTTPTAIRMMKSLAVTLQWTCYTFDVATAFLSGKNTDREVYVRAPAQGLPATKTTSAVGPFELMRVVKSAYGLAEAPRLWYLRAVELLQQVGMEEIPFCRSTFVAQDDSGVFAFCGLHVDDGFLVGDPQKPQFAALKSRIDQNFNIKGWESLNMKGIDYLGMKVRYDSQKNEIIDDMKEYVLKITPVDMSEIPKGKLIGKSLTSYRQLVMRMRWPIQHVLPEFMFRASSLAQAVSVATHEHVKEANTLLQDLHTSARNGEAQLTYRALHGEPLFVTYFDAALGKKDGVAQSGEIHLLTDTQAISEKRMSNILEFHSNKISRVVRSSMAAESCALTRGADHQLYNRLLYDALRFGKVKTDGSWRDTLRVPGILVTDARALYDHCHTTGHMAQERQTALDLLMSKRMIEEKLMSLRWVPTFKQLADSLTKNMKDILLRQLKRDGLMCLTSTHEDVQEEQRRSQIRKGQRERRAARAKQDQQSLFGM